MCVNACGMCPLSQGRVSMRMMCVLISLLHQIITILSVTKNVDVLSCVAILVLYRGTVRLASEGVCVYGSLGG